MMDDIEVWNIVALCFNACQVVFVFGAGRCTLKSRQVHKHTLAAWNNSCCNGSFPIRSHSMWGNELRFSGAPEQMRPDWAWCFQNTSVISLPLCAHTHTHSYISTNRSAHTAPSSVRLPDWPLRPHTVWNRVGIKPANMTEICLEIGAAGLASARFLFQTITSKSERQKAGTESRSVAKAGWEYKCPFFCFF